MATTFKQMTQAEPKTMLVVDSLNFAFRWKHMGAKEFVVDYLRAIDSFKKSFKAAKVIIACDGSGGSKYRKNIFPEYKSGRKEKQEAQTDKERLDFEEFFKEFCAVIDMYKEVDDYPVLQFSGVEADDIGAYIVKKYGKSWKIKLLSSDRDWDLLISDNVSRFSYVTRKEVTLDTWNDFYECTPEEYISIKVLQGDSGDSVPGVDGIGPKKAQDLLNKYGTAYDIAANMPISSKYKYIANLNNFGSDNIIRNYQLMDLECYCEDAIGVENSEVIDKILENYLK